jgi:UDP-2,3-diacylglucosamine pyrophosphatase LpxH
MPGMFKVVVSDLHIGAGYSAEGNTLEDFTSDRELAGLLDELAAESRRVGADLELIVNGDAFEMLQVPHVDRFDPATHYRPEDYHSTSEADCARKMALIVQGHRRFFNALRDFMALGPPRRSVTFIKGNHDLELYWPAVRDLIRKATAAFDARAPLLRFEERCLCREGVYVEHGNQYAETISRVRDMDDPRDPREPDQLDLPLGSRLLIDVFNDVERERYWVDGVKPIGALLWYALVYDFHFAARTLAWFIRALPGVVVDGLLSRRDPRVDLLHQLEDPARVREIGARYQADEAFRAWIDAEVSQILPQTLEASAQDADQEVVARDGVSRGDDLRRQVRSSLYDAATQRAAEHGASLVIFGHTHLASVEELGNGATYINSGTWTWLGDFSGAGKETWRDLFEHPERYTGNLRLTYVRVDYDKDGQPLGRLVVRELGQGRRWLPPAPRWWRRFRDWLAALVLRFMAIFRNRRAA